MSEKRSPDEHGERRGEQRELCRLRERELDLLQGNIAALTAEVGALKKTPWASRLDIVAKATAPVAMLLLSFFLGWAMNLSADVVRIDTNQRTVMATIKEMADSAKEFVQSVSDLKERLGVTETKVEALEHPRGR